MTNPITTDGTDAEIVTIRPGDSVMTKQRLPNFVGIGRTMAGTTGISMNLVVIPPGVPHRPVNPNATETAPGIVARNDATERESVVPCDPARRP